MGTKIIYFVFLLTFLFVTPASSKAQEQNFASSASFAPVIAQVRADTRVAALRAYLEKYNSPLAPYAEQFVYQADTYQLPYEMLPAIAGVESTFGKEVPCTNAWGWGIYTNHMYCFDSYPQAIQVITQALREKYINQWGASNIYELGSHYAASPTWAQRVVYFMNDIATFKVEYDRLSLPISL